MPGATPFLLTAGATTVLPTAGATAVLPTPGATAALPTQGATAVLPTPGATVVLPTPDATAVLPTAGATAVLPTPGLTVVLPTTGATVVLPTPGATAALPTPGATTLLPTPASCEDEATGSGPSYRCLTIDIENSTGCSNTSVNEYFFEKRGAIFLKSMKAASLKPVLSQICQFAVTVPPGNILLTRVQSSVTQHGTQHGDVLIFVSIFEYEKTSERLYLCNECLSIPSSGLYSLTSIVQFEIDTYDRSHSPYSMRIRIDLTAVAQSERPQLERVFTSLTQGSASEID
ncbi:hypothetical protein BaRGS_00015311 [Batillaria attramentaria]|uniref:Uncharacterized protein n=1 Tax=Batillaria attramentaria TaxID=370345 RepID=A0ABD0L240_9CAEN